MVRQTAIRGAYHKVGDPSTKRTSGASKCFAFVGIFIVALFFLSLGGDPPEKDNLREGQAHHSSIAKTPLSSEDENYTGQDYPSTAEEDVNETVEEATEGIVEAEDEELAKETTMLGNAVSSMGSKLRIGLGKLLGKNVDDEELESIASEVETKLNDEVGDELQEAADHLTGSEVNNMESFVDGERGEGVGAEGIERDVWNTEKDAEGRIRSGIDSAAEDIESGMKKKAAEIEKEILEQRLSERLHKKVKLVIVDDEIKGVDDIFQGLDNLAGSGEGGQGGGSGTIGNSNGYSSGSQGSGYSSPYTGSGSTPNYGTTQSQQGSSSNTYSSLRASGTSSEDTTQSKPDNDSDSEDSSSEDDN